jgi:hypothetical protein
MRKLGAGPSPDCLSRRPLPIARGKWARHLRSITPCQKRYCIQPRGSYSLTWEECRRCGGLAVAVARTCKRALRWRPAVRPTAARILSHQAAVLNLSCRLSFVRVFRAPKSGNRNVHGIQANYPSVRLFPNEMKGRFDFSAGLLPLDSLASSVPTVHRRSLRAVVRLIP